MTFNEWFYKAPHRAKYTNDHPAYLAAQEAWEARAVAVPHKWVGLKDDEVRQICGSVPVMREAVREAEAKLKEKNGF